MNPSIFLINNFACLLLFLFIFSWTVLLRLLKSALTGSTHCIEKETVVDTSFLAFMQMKRKYLLPAQIHSTIYVWRCYTVLKDIHLWMNEKSKEEICKKNKAHGWSPDVLPTLNFSYEQDSCGNYLYETKTIYLLHV